MGSPTFRYHARLFKNTNIDMLQIYNTLTGKKEKFVPITPGKVKIYVCGMTVYDYCHIGHARVLVVFDMVVRYLRASGYDVTYVRNITDIDDKIIQRANENGESIDTLTARFIDYMHEDAAALAIEPPDYEPRATEHIDQIIEQVSHLIENKHAYIADNHDVYFDVSSFAPYGKLSGKQPEELRAGARVEVEEAKDDPLDFVLWKAAKPDEPSWDSPWGAGRPGWHIECSAMSTHCLGNHFDIHGGGQDLQFPHHENEIAQSEGASAQKFVNTWMHNGFVRVDDEKMSKSLGNFFTVREVLQKYRPEEIRYFILSSHYRSPLNYSLDNLNEARSALHRLYTALKQVPMEEAELDDDYMGKFMEVMDDDFNTARALAVMHDIVSELNRTDDKSSSRAGVLANTLRHIGSIVGLLQADPDIYLKSAVGSTDDTLTDEQIETYIEHRNTARQEKNFAEADRIRELLEENGILLEDNPDGTSWRRQ